VSEYREFKNGEIIAGTRYRVVRLVGVGGMGSVYEVEHVELGKRFVLKALLRQLARRHDLVQRLRNEWRALGRLEHPNIVTVTDAGTSEGGVPFYVMERLDGETLAVRMRKGRRFPIPEALGIASRVLEGLAAAHQIGVVHRDIKPPNIFMVGPEQPKILDFGVAKIADDPGVITARGVAIGTPRYMSPEQARGEVVDSRSDIYSTGLILFEMITGVNPFEDARDPKELLVAHLTRSAPRLSSIARGVPEELDVVLGQMLAKDVEGRPANAREAAAALFRLRERSTELALRQVDSSVDVAPLVSAAALDGDTTRPDGVASRSRTQESSSAGRIAWTRDSDAAPSGAALEPSRFEPTAATVRALTGPSGGLTDHVPSEPRSLDAPLSSRGANTEMFEGTPVPPTRTRAPITPSETPSSRKAEGSFRPPEELIPNFRPGIDRWVPWLGLSAVSLGIAALVAFGIAGENESPPPAATKVPPLSTQHSALRPSDSQEAAITPPALPSSPGPAVAASGVRKTGKAGERSSERRVRPPNGLRPSPKAGAAPASPVPASARPPEPRRPSDPALPASGL
jgi:serine/threonine-protein kinase